MSKDNDDLPFKASDILELKKQNPWLQDDYATEATYKTEEVVVEATLSYTMIGSVGSIEDYLVRFHGFIKGIPYSVYDNVKTKSHTYKQKQRRIVNEAKPEYQYEPNSNQYEKWQKDIWEAMISGAKNEELEKKKELEKIIKQQEEEKLNPLKFFSLKDLTE